MTIDTSWEPLGDLAAQLSAAQDRRAMQYTSTSHGVDPFHMPSNIEIKKNVIDPSGGALYTGGSSWVPGMPLMVSSAGLAGAMPVFAGDPFTCLGNFPPGLGGFDAAEAKAPDDSARTEDFKKILIIASQPGTPAAGIVAKKLAEKSLKLAQLGDDRAQVTQDARRQYMKLQAEVDALDARAQNLFNKGDFAGAEKLRAEGAAKAKLALGFQKVNALSSGLTENAVAQAKLAQRIADAVLAGRPDVAAVLGVAYDKLASHSDSMRGIRAQQVAKAKSGLGYFADGMTDMYERDIIAIQKEDRELFAGLRAYDGMGELGRLFKGKIAKKIRAKVLKPIGKGLKTAAQAVGKVAAKMTVGLACKIERSKLVTKVAAGVGQAVGTFYGGPVGGAVGKRAVERARQDSGTVCNALDKIGITKGKFHKGAVKGALKGAAKEIAKRAVDPKEALKTLTSVGTAYVGGGAGGSAGSALTKLVGGGGAGGLLQKVPVANLVKAATGGKTDASSILSTFAKGGGGEQMQFGLDAFKKFGLDPKVYMNRMTQVATQQVASRGQSLLANAAKQQAGNLIAGALRAKMAV